jgi:predicted enzyme related to lactoylglutathione lyase
MSNPFCHVELHTESAGTAKEFYGKLFDWRFEDSPSPVPGGVYTHIKVGDGTGGGLMKKAMPEAPTAWLPYVLVDDVDATLKKARGLGAKVVLEKVTVPEMGAYAVMIDPSGAALGLWHVAKK